MFRKIKKLYFKIYHLFKLISIFILVFGFSVIVKADCEELTITNYEYQSTQWRITPTQTLENNQEYIIYFGNADKTFRENLIEMEITLNQTDPQLWVIRNSSSAPTCDLDAKYCTQIENRVATENMFVFRNIPFTNTQNATKFSNNVNKFHFVKGGVECLPQDEPTTEGIFGSYVTLYGDRITYLANGFNTNESFKYFIGIIIAFIVLELTIRIINIRRVKR